MGFPLMLNGLNKKLTASTVFTCPKCGNEFNSYEIVNMIRDNEYHAEKKCPICHESVPVKALAQSLLDNSK